jgi:phenylacetate-CoA ligase
MSTFRTTMAAAYEAAEREHADLSAAAYAPEKVSRIQNAKLHALWDRLDRSPYYRDLPHVRRRDFEASPVTPRSALKAQPIRFVCDGGIPARYYETSGSTGSPTPTPRLAEDIAWNTVSVASMWRRTLTEGDRVASVLPSDVVPVGDLVASVCEHLDCTLLRCYPFTQGICDWQRLEQLFVRFQPHHVFIAPGVLLQWTRLLKQHGRLADVRSSVRTLMLLGEVSTRPLRARLGELWQCAVTDASYGSTETGTIGAGCEHDRMHLLPAGHIAELWDGAEIRLAAPGQTGQLTTTTLNNYARPLLRYCTGDVATILPGQDCPCGMRLPVLRIHGRESDMVSVDGRQVSVETVESVVYKATDVTGYLIQLGTGEKPAARLVLERDVDFDGVPESVIDQIGQRFSSLGIQWDQIVLVGQLPPVTKAGASHKNWKRTNVQWVKQ